MKDRIAVIAPLGGKNDTSIETVLDGFLQLQKEYPQLEFHTSAAFDTNLHLDPFLLDRDAFIEFAKRADIILLVCGKKHTDVALASLINRWDRTVFIDGSEVGGNLRYDPAVQKALLARTFSGFGRIDQDMLDRCLLYFRREKPYVDGIIPFPFGIDTRYVRYDPMVKKDIDFTCVFGQEHHPSLRREVREELEKYCSEQGFTCWTQRTETPEEFHRILARSKVGISVGGGGFDTLRFWEILGNNCLLMTERIDIYSANSRALDYERIFQFDDLEGFRKELQRVGAFLRAGYAVDDLTLEYQEIMKQHSSQARALQVLETSRQAVVSRTFYANQCSILVMSYDANEDLWDPFFTLLFRYWPDCPFPVYLMTNTKPYHHDRVTTLHVGGGTLWGRNVKQALQHISTPFILPFIEDFFLDKTIATNHILQLLKLADEEHIACIQLCPSPDMKPDTMHSERTDIGYIDTDSSIRTSLRTAIWNREIFNELVREDETAWDFEEKGVIRSRSFDKPFCMTTSQVVSIYTDAGVRQGKWVYGTFQIMRKEKIRLNKKKRVVDYRTKWNSVRDQLRKKPIAKFIRRLPLIGDLLSWLYWK